jgi:hypothetical protein
LLKVIQATPFQAKEQFEQFGETVVQSGLIVVVPPAVVVVVDVPEQLGLGGKMPVAQCVAVHSPSVEPQ